MNNAKDYKYLYEVYGLHIASNIRIKEFLEVENRTEVKDFISMDYADMEPHIKESIREGHNIIVDNNITWFHIPDVATYLIEDGKKILVEPEKGHNEIMLRIYILGSIMGFLMIQRRKLAIHGGTILFDDKAVIITGERKAGKSTLCAALGKKGYKFVADDVAAITYNKNISMVEPGFPYHKLCLDALEDMGYDESMFDKFDKFDGDGQIKYLVPDFEKFQHNPVQLFALCELVQSDVDEVKIERIKGNEKLLLIMRNVYRGEYIGRVERLKGIYLQKCLDVATIIECYRISRPKNQYTVEEQIERLEEILGSKDIGMKAVI